MLSRSQASCLEDQIAGARLALACSYSCSDEYEAAIITARRDAGVYGGRRRQRHSFLVLTAAFALLLLLIAGS
jgi:hypothetical protein